MLPILITYFPKVVVSIVTNGHQTANNLLFAQAFNTQYNILSSIITRRSLVRLLLGVQYLDFFKK